MTVEDRIRLTIGDLTFQVASLTTQLEGMTAERDSALDAVRVLTDRLNVAVIQSAGASLDKVVSEDNPK